MVRSPVRCLRFAVETLQVNTICYFHTLRVKSTSPTTRSTSSLMPKSLKTPRQKAPLSIPRARPHAQVHRQLASSRILPSPASTVVRTATLNAKRPPPVPTVKPPAPIPSVPRPGSVSGDFTTSSIRRADGGHPQRAPGTSIPPRFGPRLTN